MSDFMVYLWRFALLAALVGLAFFSETGWAIFIAFLLVASMA